MGITEMKRPVACLRDLRSQAQLRERTAQVRAAVVAKHKELGYGG